MSFGSLFDGGAGGGGGGMQFPFSAGFSSSPGLSLGLDNNAGGGGMGGGLVLPGGPGAGGGSGAARDADAENDSRSGSDHLDAMSGGGEDEDDAEPGNPRKRKKRYHRHTPQQIQELEALFKECPHPDEKQRGELSRRLGLDPRQVKFWFQNRRTQMKVFPAMPILSFFFATLISAAPDTVPGPVISLAKTQLERHENALLKQENDKLRAENMTIREAMRSPMCGSCGSPAMLGEVSLEEQHLCIENARLKDELNRVYALATKFLGKPMSMLAGPLMQPHLSSLPMPSSSLELAIGGFRGLGFCKQLAEGAWAVVDVSIDGLMRDQNSATTSNAANIRCRRLPSGCVMQDTPNGYCKVTWVEHTEYDEASVHQLYRPLLRSGLAFGARRWLAMLQRQCECLAILMSPDTVSANDSSVITQEGKRSMLKLARRMTENFCAGVSASSAREWSKLDGATGSIGEDVRVMARKSVDEPGEPPGVVLSAATSVWVPVAPEKLFNFLRDEQLRAEWDILSNGGPMQEMANIAKGQEHGNSVSLLRASAMSANQSSMLILQETCTDASGSMVVYAPVDIPAMQLVMNGGDSTYVALLPSGFAILPDGPSAATGHKTGGSLLTVAFQILVNSQPTAKLTVESVETVNNLISCTIKKIKTALQCDAT
ncbi:homeobox-leucine zipper protein ROC5-like isoform X2 [Panicum miliaceum]|uniref:Homeobox-leucine zipper protein ROC5-like isoform X2 n=1 Tax=Panicum miliaceum TaxID=4540 RepID=A0A3L6SNG9_PANMI|nr:homeobox-leucine zipper protein ROC5-like isoform X2 [Panicum miliaceum]